MTETRKLFDEEPYRVDFEAKVLGAQIVDLTSKKQKKGKKSLLAEIVLDRTLFFPEEGGQTPDTGLLAGFPVVDVQLENGLIRHMVQVPDPGAGALPQIGGTVCGTIDWGRRFSNMQNHSGEHILSGLVHNRFGYDNVGFHLSDNTVTLDFNGPLTDDDVLWLEEAANRVVWNNVEIRAWYPAEEELRTAEYRSKKEIDGPLRLVEIPGVDLCACCAPHVRRTGEIGLIKIIRVLRERTGIRLTILCGSRALVYMQTLQKAAEDVSHLTNMPREEIAAGTGRLLEENEKLKQREAALENQVIEALAASVPADQTDVFLFTAASGGADGAGIGNLAQRRLVNALCEAHDGYCAVFAGTDQTGYKYIIGAGEETAPAAEKKQKSGSAETGTADAGRKEKGSGVPGTKTAVSVNSRDARVLNACLHKACGARGGGKPAMVQGSVHAPEEQIRAALEAALHEQPAET